MQHSKYGDRVALAIFIALKVSVKGGDKGMGFLDLFSEY